MEPGDVVGERFEIHHLAGSGGVGAVYRANDRATGSPVALKVLLGPPRPEETRRFEREALALAGLEHPGIVRYVAHGQTHDGRPYLVMAWIEGEDLEARLSRGPLGVDETLTLGARLADALGAAHASGIVHRDLKPANVVLAGGALAEAKIIDFGLAMRPNTARATRTGTIIGTPAYMAPEQAMGGRELDPRVDVFALGCILYECLAGKPAFEGMHVMAVLAKIVVEEVPSLRTLGYAVPVELDALVSRMLAKPPANRPPDGASVAAVLRALEGAPATWGESTLAQSEALTRAEERLVCVVLAKPPQSDEPNPTSDTLALSGVARMHEVVLSDIEARGGVAAVLVDGTIAVTARATGLATDQAAAAAGYALSLRERFPGWAIAVATGRAEMRAARPIGDAIEAATQRIRARRGRGDTARIDLDEVTAGLLDLRFEVTAGALGLELAGEHDVAEKARTLLGRPTPTVGRDRELATLRALFEECTSEPAARVVLVTGPAGVGKSRLRHDLVERARAQSAAEVWMARGDPARTGAPFGLLAQLVRRAARLDDGEPAPGGMQKLLARVSRHVPVPDRRRVAEFLGELTGTHFPDEGRAELRAAREAPVLLGGQVRRAWLDLVGAETSAGPLLVVLEDVHWGDASSVEIVDEALRLFSDRPLMVLAAARPEVHERLPRLFHGRAVLEVRLPALPARACERLAREVLGTDVAPETVQALWERSGGNAFFLEELLRATAEGRTGELPETVLAMVESRLDALDPDDRRLLRAASVFGDVFWRGGVRALLGGDARLDERLLRLEDKEWIARRTTPRFHGEEEYAFRHATVREAAYGTLTAADRALGHRLAAAWLAEAGETDARVLAQHDETAWSRTPTGG